MAAIQKMRGRALIPAAAVLGAVALTLLRLPPDASMYVPLFIQSLVHPATLGRDPVVLASLSHPYMLAPWGLARTVFRLWVSTGADPRSVLSLLNLALWAAQAALMYGLALEITESEAASFLATLMFGFDMPLFLADAPQCLQYLERSLGMVPLLWGLRAIVAGRRWRALAAVALATFLHGNPAIYVWPVMLLEDGLEAWRRPSRRRGAALRLGAALLVAAPLLASAGKGPYSEGARESARFSLAVLGPWIGGFGLSPADHLFRLEGLLLGGLFAWRKGALRVHPVLLRAAALCPAMLLAGSVAYLAYTPGSLLWGALVKMQLWISLYLLELAGHLLLAGWLVSEMGSGQTPWPVVLALLSLSSYHDFVLQGVAIGLCLLRGHLRYGYALTLAAAAISVLFFAFPAPLLAAGRALGLRGGIFTLPAFRPAVGAALAACLALDACLRKLGPRTLKVQLGIAAVLLIASALARRAVERAGKDDSPDRMAAWIRRETPEETAILISPINLSGIDCYRFMASAERPVAACASHFNGIMMFGRAGAPILRRLSAVGINIGNVAGPRDFDAEISRADRELDQAMVDRLRREYGVEFLLTAAGRPWPTPVAHQAGSLVLRRAARL